MSVFTVESWRAEEIQKRKTAFWSHPES